ncbi:DUF6801 domain-containing protein [Actinomadura verrucosospora]|uniref:DUF6801 domain-containing protein n=1 Tax=Actinomadura verrucosospora TaxID=46165 RepID=A0A7D3ZLE3_ACTVE|nr:DUF6801 domain-containing protein [Actinomadura verrucosospora]QKG27097.1 hypothetical protein ACTIVE_8750 [Actinomadura verrucosospora]
MTKAPGRTAAGLAATAAVVALTPGAAHGATGFRTTLSYQCATAAGLQKATVRISGKAPASGAPGRPLTIGPVTVTVTGGNRTTGLLGGKTGGEQAGGTISLAVTAGQAGGRPVDAQWPPLPVKAAHDTTITATGPVPSVTPMSGGGVTWRAGDLTIAPADAGRPVKCTADREAVLTTVPVPARRKAVTPPTARTPLAPGRGAGRTAIGPMRLADDLPPCDPKPAWTWNPDPALQMPELPPGTTVPPEDKSQPECGRLNVVSNIGKAHVAALTQGMVSVLYTTRAPRNEADNYIRYDNLGVVATNPATTSTLGFGFLPTTATSVFQQVGVGNISLISPLDWTLPGGPGPARVLAKAKENVRVTAVQANGVPIPVGPRCGTAKPMTVALTRDAGRSSVQEAGLYSGSVTVPRFAGCGVGEDISPLLTASISGSGNTVEINQSALCKMNGPSQPCTPGPVAKTAWSVKPGGKIVGTGSGVTIADADFGGMITCTTSKITLDASLPHRTGRIADISGFAFDGCTNEVGVPYEVTAVPDHGRHLQGASYDPTTGQSLMTYRLRMRLKGADGCTAELGNGAAPPGNRPQTLSAMYDNATHTLHLFWSLNDFTPLWVSTATGCEASWQTRPAGTGVLLGIDINTFAETGIYSFSPAQTITGPTP